MSAAFDTETPRAAFGEALAQQTLNKLGDWLGRDGAIAPGVAPADQAAFLLIYYITIIQMRRRGPAGVGFMIDSLNEIIEALADGRTGVPE